MNPPHYEEINSTDVSLHSSHFELHFRDDAKSLFHQFYIYSVIDISHRLLKNSDLTNYSYELYRKNWPQISYQAVQQIPFQAEYRYPHHIFSLVRYKHTPMDLQKLHLVSLFLSPYHIAKMVPLPHQ